jgi:hypothetical protein
MGRLFLVFAVYATGREVVAAGAEYEKLLDVMLETSARRPCELVELVYSLETGRAEERPLAEAGNLSEFMRIEAARKRAAT